MDASGPTYTCQGRGRFLRKSPFSLVGAAVADSKAKSMLIFGLTSDHIPTYKFEHVLSVCVCVCVCVSVTFWFSGNSFYTIKDIPTNDTSKYSFDPGECP